MYNLAPLTLVTRQLYPAQFKKPSWGYIRLWRPVNHKFPFLLSVNTHLCRFLWATHAMKVVDLKPFLMGGVKLSRRNGAQPGRNFCSLTTNGPTAVHHQRAVQAVKPPKGLIILIHHLQIFSKRWLFLMCSAIDINEKFQIKMHSFLGCSGPNSFF